MLLNKKNSLSFLFVLILGLISCSKDKEVVYQSQSVGIERIGMTDSQNRKLMAEDIKSFDLGGHLVVDLWQEPDFTKNPMLIRVQSQCESDVRADGLESDRYFQNQFTIPFLQILSKNALLSAQQKYLQCGFTITVIDQNTSASAVYNMPPKIFININEYSNWLFFPEEKNSYTYDSVKKTPLPEGNEYTIHCTDFRKVLNTKEALTLEDLIASEESELKTWQTPRQNCRLMVAKEKQILLSKPFVLAFQPLPLLIDYILHPLNTGMTPLLPRHILTMRVMNPNSFDVQLKVENISSSLFSFQPVYVGPAPVGHLGQVRNHPLLWSYAQNSLLQHADSNQWVFNFPAKRELEFYATYDVKMDCGHARERVNGHNQVLVRRYHQNPIFIGIKYGFDLQTKFLVQVDDSTWAESDLKIKSLAALQTDPLPFWDIYYLETKGFFGTFFFHPAATQEQFMQTIRPDIPYDSCKPL